MVMKKVLGKKEGDQFMVLENLREKEHSESA